MNTRKKSLKILNKFLSEASPEVLELLKTEFSEVYDDDITVKEYFDFIDNLNSKINDQQRRNIK